MSDWTDFPTCPWCGFEDQDWWDGRGDTRDGSTWTEPCPNCERTETKIDWTDWTVERY